MTVYMLHVMVNAGYPLLHRLYSPDAFTLIRHTGERRYPPQHCPYSLDAFTITVYTLDGYRLPPV